MHEAPTMPAAAKFHPFARFSSQTPRNTDNGNAENSCPLMAGSTIALFLTSAGIIAAPIVMQLTGSSEATELVKPIAEEAVKQARGLLEDSNMRYYCFVGAFCGSWISLLAFWPRTAREMASKWIVSFFLACCIMPAVIEGLGYARSTSWVLALSCLGALFAWALLQALYPILLTIAESRVMQAIRSYLPGSPDKPAHRRRRK